MSEIKGLLLTKEEEKACVDLIKKMREEKFYTFEFFGHIKIRATTREEANKIFKEWATDLQNTSRTNWGEIIVGSPYFNTNCFEEE